MPKLLSEVAIFTAIAIYFTVRFGFKYKRVKGDIHMERMNDYLQNIVELFVLSVILVVFIVPVRLFDKLMLKVVRR